MIFFFLIGQFLRNTIKSYFFVPFLMKLKLNVGDIRQVDIISFLLERDTMCSGDPFSMDQWREKARVQWQHPPPPSLSPGSVHEIYLDSVCWCQMQFRDLCLALAM